MSDFSSNLRRLRKRAGLSQDALAEKLSVARQTVSSWERGNSYPDLDMLVHISDALATDPNELLYPNQKRRSGGVSRLVDDDFSASSRSSFGSWGSCSACPPAVKAMRRGRTPSRGISCFPTRCDAGLPHF